MVGAFGIVVQHDTLRVRITCVESPGVPGWEVNEKLGKLRSESSWEPHLAAAAARHGCDYDGPFVVQPQR